MNGMMYNDSYSSLRTSKITSGSPTFPIEDLGVADERRNGIVPPVFPERLLRAPVAG